MAERTPFLKHTLIVLLESIGPGVNDLLAISFLMQFWVYMVMWVSKQSVGCFSWPLESPPWLSCSREATVMVWTFFMVQSLCAWFLGISSDLTKGVWSWPGPLPILLACPGPSALCLEVGRHIWSYSGHLSFRTSPPDTLPSERSRLKY